MKRRVGNKFFDDISAKYGRPDYYDIEYHLRNSTFKEIKELIRYYRIKNVLEAGCGNGILTEQISKLKFKITAVDFSIGMLREAKKRVGSICSVSFVRANLKRIPFKNESFDLVILSNVLINQNDEDAKKIIRECCRVLKPGGFLVLNFEKRRSIWSLCLGLGRSDKFFARAYNSGFIMGILNEEKLSVAKILDVGFERYKNVKGLGLIMRKEEKFKEKIKRIFSSRKSFIGTVKYIMIRLCLKVSISLRESPARIIVAKKHERNKPALE